MTATLPFRNESDAFSVADLDDVRAWGWSPLRLAQELGDFRVRSIEGITADCQRRPEQWGSIHVDYPDTWRILTAGPERIVGYWQLLPLNPTVRDAVISGRSTVSLPIEQVVRPLTQPGWYDVLVYSISIDPQYRNLFTAMLLANSMIRVFIDLARRGIFFRDVIAGILSREGRLMNLGLGIDLEYVADHEVIGRMYAGRLPSILRRPIVAESSDEMMRTLAALYAAQGGEDEASSGER